MGKGRRRQEPLGECEELQETQRVGMTQAYPRGEKVESRAVCDIKGRKTDSTAERSS